MIWGAQSFTTSPGVIPLPVVSYETFPVSGLGGVRLAVTSVPLTPTQVAAVEASAVSKRPGAGSIADTLNRRFWFRTVQVETEEGSQTATELFFDDTPNEGTGGSWGGAGEYAFFKESQLAGWRPIGAIPASASAADLCSAASRSRFWPGVRFEVAPKGSSAHLGLPSLQPVAGGTEGIFPTAESAAGVNALIAYSHGSWTTLCRNITIDGGAAAVGGATSTTRDASGYQALVTSVFGFAPGIDGDSSAANAGSTLLKMVPWTYPGGAGWIPGMGLRAHGIHRSVKSIQILAGRVVRIIFTTTGHEMATCFRAWKALTDASHEATLEATAANVASSVGDKQVMIQWTDAETGPFDIYNCAQIVKALDQGASRGDIDSHVVSGRRCDAWRAQMLKRAPTRVQAWVISAGLSIVRRTVTKSAGVAVINTPPTSGVVLIPEPVYGVGATQFGSEAELMTALGLAYPNLTFVIDGPEDPEIELRELHASLGDPAYLWWQSAGFAEIGGLVTSMITAACVPGRVA